MKWSGRENIVPENLYIMKGINKKGIFSIKKCLPIQIMISSCFENFGHPCWKHFNIETLSFSNSIYIYIYIYIYICIIYIYMLLKQCFLIVFHFSTHNQLSAFFRENNAIQNRWMSVHVTSDPRGRGELFQAPSSPFYLVRACSSSSCLFHATALQNVFTCKFTIS